MNRGEKLKQDFGRKLTEAEQVEAMQMRAMAVHLTIVDLINAGATDLQLQRMLPGYRNGEWWREHAKQCNCEEGLRP